MHQGASHTRARRQPPHLVLDADIGSAFDQRPRRPKLVVAGGEVEGGAPENVSLVDIGLGLHQQPDAALVAAAGGVGEGGPPELPAAQGASAVRGGSARACGGVRGCGR